MKGAGDRSLIWELRSHMALWKKEEVKRESPNKSEMKEMELDTTEIQSIMSSLLIQLIICQII